MWMPPTLETKRLILRELHIDDAEDIFAYAKKKHISEYTLWEPHQSLEDSETFISDYVQSSYEDGAPEPFAIVEKKSRRVIGTVGCFWVSKTNRHMELAYALNDEFWGQGLVVEAAQAVIDYCFSFFEVDRIQCRCKVQNIASFRVMEKLNFTYEGVLRNAIYHRECSWDLKVTSLLLEEWTSTKKGPYIRRARIGDEEGIHLAHMKSIQKVNAKDYRPDQIEAWGNREFHSERRKKAILNHHLWVVEQDNSIEGYALIFDSKKDSTVEIYGLYLTSEVLSKGLGSTLMDYMIDMSILLNKKKIKATSTLTAIGFYEKMGFKRVGNIELSPINGADIEGQPMELIL